MPKKDITFCRYSTRTERARPRSYISVYKSKRKLREHFAIIFLLFYTDDVSVPAKTPSIKYGLRLKLHVGSYKRPSPESMYQAAYPCCSASEVWGGWLWSSPNVTSGAPTPSHRCSSCFIVLLQGLHVSR